MGVAKKENSSEILVDKVVFQYLVCLLSLTVGKLLLRLIVTSGTLCVRKPTYDNGTT